MMDIYPYDQADSRKNLQCYMYCDFRGVDFLKSYVSARRVILDECHELMAKIGSRDNALLDEEQNVQSTVSLPGTGAIETKPLIELCLVNLVSGKQLTATFEWLDIFLRKFEITKRIYVSYGQNLRPRHGADTTAEVSAGTYAQLAACYARALEYKMDLRWLNVLLKLNDLVSFNIKRLEITDHLEAAMIAMRSELSLIDNMVGDSLGDLPGTRNVGS